MTADDTGEVLLKLALAGDIPALAALFSQHRDRLKRMVKLRLDRRLQGRVDASDVLQEAYLDLAQRLPEYGREPKFPLYLWMRLVTGQRLAQVHRKHLGAAMRNAELEVSIYQKALPQASTEFLAAVGAFHVGQPAGRAGRAANQAARDAQLDGRDRPRDSGSAALRGIEQRRGGPGAGDSAGHSQQTLHPRTKATERGNGEHPGDARRMMIAVSRIFR